jgi:outer membrane immunogenic protein
MKYFLSKVSHASMWLLFVAFTFTFAAQAYAQSTPRIEVGADYSYVRSNTPPGGCACFSLNGGGGSAAYYLNRSFAIAGEVSSGHSSDIGISGTDLTLTSYVFGPRYYWRSHRKVMPFTQVLLGGVHANDSLALQVAGQQVSQNAFATKVGGGLDWPINQRFSLRPFEANYFLTHFANGVNDHQNNLQLGAGVVLRFGER